MEERHDCQNPECPEWQKQLVLDAMSIMLNQIFLEIDEGKMADPLDLIEKSVRSLRALGPEMSGQTVH
jgi:EAL domain-containing protein (putative c-di-GMP-specific phosphodiesterase class I)